MPDMNELWPVTASRWNTSFKISTDKREGWQDLRTVCLPLLRVVGGVRSPRVQYLQKPAAADSGQHLKSRQTL